MACASKDMKLEMNLHSFSVVGRLDNMSLAKSVEEISHTVRGALNYGIRRSFTGLFLEDKAFRPLSSFSLSPSFFFFNLHNPTICERSLPPHLSFFSRSHLFPSFRVYQKRGSTQRIPLPGRPPTCLSLVLTYFLSSLSSLRFFPFGL